MKICVFAYNFEHNKTQNGLVSLISNKFKINQVIASNKLKIFSPKKKINIGFKDVNYNHPKKLCASLNIPYKVLKHNSKNCLNFLKKKKFDLGIILGARILKEDIIKTFKIGILNLHPGLLPDNRGLDTYQWAIINMIPQGVTSHLIDSKMDGGKILIKKKIKIYQDDTLNDLYMRVQSLEMKLMIQSINLLNKNNKAGYFPSKLSQYHSYLPSKLEKKMITNFTKYKKKFSSI